MRFKRIIFVLIIFFAVMINSSYAAGESKIELVPDNSNVNKGSEISLGIKVKNAEIQEGIYDVMGALVYDNKNLELVILDVDDLTAEQKQTIEKAEQLVGLLDILCVTDKCLIGGIADGDSYLLTIVYLDEQEVVEFGNEEEMGSIKFKVLNSSSSGKTEIKFKDCEVNGELKLNDTVTSINILGSSPIIEDEEENKVEIQNQIIEDDDEVEEIENEEPINNIQDSNNETNEKIEEIIDAGSEDYIPYIVTLAIISMVSYIQYKKYKNI